MPENLEMKHIVAAELNHHNTPIAVRESVAFQQEMLEHALKSLHQEIEEVYILSTCNRLAVYGYCEDTKPIKSFFDQFPDVQQYLTEFNDTNSAVNHLFATASGLESQALGEHQILGQIRTGFDNARNAATLGPVFNELLRKAIRVGKRVRGETHIGKYPTSLASVALQLINQNIEQYPEKRILILGTGEMATLTARLLSKSQFPVITVASQSAERADEFAKNFGFQTESYEGLSERLDNYDILIGATASTTPVLNAGHFSKSNNSHHQMLIDLGVPRNFDSNLRQLENIRLYDLDDIKAKTQKGLEQRKQEVPKARSIISEELNKFEYWLNTRNVTPLIAGLYDQLQDLKDEEYKWALPKLKEEGANHEVILDRMLHRMVRKFVKNPVDQLKNYAQENNKLQEPSETFKQVFDLKQTHFHVPRKRIVIGSRGSKLALKQASNVITLLKKIVPDYEFEVKKIKTSGDSGDLVPIGAFCKEIDNELIHKGIDLAVHCLKDMPTQLPEGLMIGSILKRDDHRDAFLSNNNIPLEELRHGAIVGTSSLRRGIQIKALRPDVEIKPLRGNIYTRMQKMEDGHYDAILLGAAGLQRMDLLDKVTELLPVSKMVPCVGQGAIALEIRELDVYLADLIRLTDHRRTHLATDAERAYLIALGGGCNMPIGAYARIENDILYMDAMLGTDDGSIIHHDSIQGPENDCKILGEKMAQRLTEKLQINTA